MTLTAITSFDADVGARIALAQRRYADLMMESIDKSFEQKRTSSV